MELITILNRCHRFRGFVYQYAHFSSDKKSIEVAVRPRKGSAAVCSRCHLPAPGYEQLAERRFEFILLLGVSRLPSVHHAARRLSPLRHCGCRRSSLGRRQTLTDRSLYALLSLSRWARRLPWKETAEPFRTSWDKVFDAVQHVVTRVGAPGARPNRCDSRACFGGPRKNHRILSGICHGHRRRAGFEDRVRLRRYWPDDEINRSLAELLHTRSPSDVVVERTFRTVDFILPYLRSDNPVLIRGAVTGVTRLLFADPPLLSAESRVRTENALIAAVENVLRTGDGQAGNNYASALGGVHDPRARDLLWISSLGTYSPNNP